ncbi:uncharacterized protein LOC123715839 [Pieris brassicae]|uniref:uncharacterized protein LOC123715839 n=1 Tax=Pieris brassicae TaxID=7116 RepID=UPI001E661773|nr:uncharacterized protein LOC123715839 [Pieris brassicae]
MIMKALVCFCFIIAIVICTEYNCDYSFGDPSWNYSKIFYDETHTIASGLVYMNFTLPRDTNQMVSFVCVNITGADLNTTQVAFASLFDQVSVDLRTAHKKDVTVHIIALEHGY